jgi:transposase
MSPPLLPDALWNLIQPLLPPSPRRPNRGRPRLPDRACLTGILFVLRSGIPWEMLPQELGCGSGMTCWRRLRDWQEAGIWQLIHFSLLDWLARWERLTGRGRSWTAVLSGQFLGAADGTESNRPSQAGQQTSSDLRRSRDSSRRSNDRSQPQRLAASPRTG